MTKRTNQTKTTIYRRHAGLCPIKGQPNNVTQCECPLWLHGKVRGKFRRESLDTRTLSTAEMRQRNIENGSDQDPTPGGGPRLVGGAPAAGNETLEFAAAEFLKTGARLSTSSKALYRRAVEHFSQWASTQDIVMLKDIDSRHIRLYFEAHADWKRSTAQGRLVHLRVFFNYCCKTKRWLTFTPTGDRTLNQKTSKQTSTRVPFTPEQITRIFQAVERMPEEQRDRARALVYLLLFTGMRISDATFCERSYLAPDATMRYFVIKTRRPIGLAPEVQAPAIEALMKLPASRVYFFQPDRDDDYQEARQALREGEEFSTLMTGYEARVRETTALVLKVLALAGIDGACHRFRDTFAINMLVGDGEKGADIYTVSKLLGHSDVRITDKHYLKAVAGYSERMSRSTRVLSYQFPLAG
jgi:integrase/recombinase XerD